MRGRPLGIGALGRAAGFVLVAAAIIATVVRLDPRKAEPSPSATPSAPSDPLAAEFARCRAIGMAAQSDAACAAAWAENRKRFFTYRPPADGAAPKTTPPALPKSEER